MATRAASRAHGFTLIRESEVEDLIDLEEAYAAIEGSYKLYSQGLSKTPATTALEVDHGRLFSFLSWLQGHRFFIAKLATVFPGNRLAGKPVVQPMIFLYDSSNGELVAALEGRHFAGVRTALSSTIAARRLVRRPAVKVAIFGTGVQARAHARVLQVLVPSVEQIKAYSPNKESRENFLKEVLPLRGNLELSVAASPREAVMEADLIICATSASQPVFEASWIQRDDICVVALGAMGPKMQEVPDELMAKAFMIVDSLKEVDTYGEVVGPQARGHRVAIGGEIGSFVSGELKVPTSGPIVFKHHGLPVTDAALAEALYDRYTEGAGAAD